MIRKLALPFLFAVAACGGSDNVSFSVRSGGATGTVRPRDGSLTLANGIVLSRVRVVIRDIQLEGAEGKAEDDSDDKTLHLDPIVVDLNAAALDGGQTQTITNANVKAGTYKTIKLKIHKPNSNESTNAAVLEMAAANASMIIDGTISGVSFSFVSSIEAKEEFPGNVVLKDGSNLTLKINPATWFGATAAAVLDPRVSGNRSQIESNIKASFKAFRDDDRNGDSD